MGVSSSRRELNESGLHDVSPSDPRMLGCYPVAAERSALVDEGVQVAFRYLERSGRARQHARLTVRERDRDGPLLFGHHLRVSGEPLDLGPCPRHHHLKVEEELFVYRVVRGPEGL